MCEIYLVILNILFFTTNTQPSSQRTTFI